MREAVECVINGDLATGKAVLALQKTEGVRFELSLKR
jgi:hypothetical protein